MSSSSFGGPDLSNIPLDILSEIIKRLDVLDFIRFGAVCSTWRKNLPCRKYCKKSQIPWMMSTTSEKPDYGYFYSIAEKKKKYEIYHPGIDGRHFIGSSQGFLISVDNFADLHVTNPITGTHISLPPTSTSPVIADVVTDPETGQITHYIEKMPPWTHLGFDYDPNLVSNRHDYHYGKVILSPSADVGVAIFGSGQLAYARIGDNKWTALHAGDFRNFFDATFHKGRLHAITSVGTIAIFDDLDGSGGATFVSPKGPLSSDLFLMRCLIESPDGEDLFLVYREEEKDGEDLPPVTVDIRVFLLDKDTYTWKQMTSLGDVALFLGYNHSMSVSLCTQDYPSLKRNSVYFIDDNILSYVNEHEFAEDMGVLNLEDGSIEYVDSDLDRLGWLQAIWFMPTLS